MEATRILVADDNDVLRRALRVLLVSEGFTVIADVGDATSAVELAERARPHVISIDLSMPGMVVPATIRRLVAVAPVLVFTGLDPSDERVIEAKRAGAAAIVSKERSPAALINELRAVLSGDVPHALSPREREVVEHVARGLHNQEVAKLLGIGVGTVRTHLRVALRKLGVRTKAEAALRLGLAARDPSTPRRRR